MPFCTKCGKQIAEGEVCSCQSQAASNPQPSAEQPAYTQQTTQQAYTQQAYVPPQAPPQPKPKKLPPHFEKSADEPKSSYILPYLGVLWLFGLLVKPDKNNPRIRFHVGQGMFLTIVSVAVSLTLGFLSIFTLIPGLGDFIGVMNTLVGVVAELGVLALNVIAIINVIRGKDEFVPIIGQFAFYK